MGWFVFFALALYPVIIDYFTLPKPATVPFLRPTCVINLISAHLLFCVVLLVTGRVLLSCAVSTAALTTLVLINNAKFRALREPVLFSDFGVAKQIVKYPKVYFPFFGTAVAVVLLACIVVGVLVFWTVDVPVGQAALDGRRWVIIYPFFLLLALVVLFFRPTAIDTVAAVLCSPGLGFDALQDVPRFGLIATIFFHYFFARRQRPMVRERVDRQLEGVRARNAHLSASDASLADLVVVVQAESFFDIRSLHRSILPDVLSHYDAALSHAVVHGKLEVPAWGANTVRTEFSVLTGIADCDLGLESGNPYLKMVKDETWSFVHRYKELGYRTVCVHPYHAGFYNRKRVFEKLGFDEFLDIRSFPRGDGRRAYIGDVEFAEKLVELFQREGGRTFIFGITMESHGPFDVAGDVAEATLLAANSPLMDTDVMAYLERLKSSDVMIKIIRDGLLRCGQEYRFCLYGDHVPSLPRTYQVVALTDPRTNYLILASSLKEKLIHRDLAAHELFERLIES